MPSAAASVGPDVDRPALPRDLALVGRVDAGDALDEHRLAGAVVAGQRGDLPGGMSRSTSVERLDGAEVLADAPQPEERSDVVADARSGPWLHPDVPLQRVGRDRRAVVPRPFPLLMPAAVQAPRVSGAQVR